MSFCRVCWAQHLDDMRTQIGSILKQLESASNRLEHKREHFTDRCERITEQINVAAEEKISAIIAEKEKLLKETVDLQKTGDLTALALKTSLEEAKAVAAREMADTKTDDERKVATFVNLHQNALQILSEVSKWDTDSFVFDKEGFRIEIDSATPVDAESDDPIPEGAKQNNPLESEDTLFLHYRSRNFVPHYVWRKASRPGGVAISPWSGHLYVCGMDIHCVLVVERSQAKVVRRLTNEDMLCPVQIAFMKSLGEVYVTDKWKHCIHVFSKDGEFLRTVGQKGSRPGMFRSPEGIATDNANQLLYVVDTGNDRVQILQPDGKFVDHLGVASKLQPINTTSVWTSSEVNCTELNAPTSVAVTSDRVIVLDSGNKRIKIYNKENKSKIIEFGSMGQRKGQFRQPEVLAVDPLGFILVGDSGNCRVQVFKQNGQLVRVFGGVGSAPGRFGWISGIYVTKQLDVIISDTKNHCVNFF
ncbi:tripartite motif-containing protein 2-like [Ostrinia nubilalis]|uniref:tripartite motif-containing protein 2-like n=1 Tax=Ostrinia nubilalis TaxID=29057 RepID=UPI0030824526